MHRHSDLLPIVLAPAAGESGVGFLLRVASTNGISMHKLRQLAGMTEAETFTAKHEDRLLALVGLAGSWPSRLLPQRISGGGVTCYGHRFRVRMMLRFRRPQFCPVCIQEARVCAAHWDLSLSVVCLRHKCFVQDLCPSCSAPVRWNRPSVEWGHCKHFLGGVAVSEDTLQDLLAVQKITEDLLNHRAPNFSPVALSCPGLSLDAWCSFLWASGVIETPDSPPRRTVITRAPSSMNARTVVARSITRLRACAESGRGLCDLAHVVAEAPLVGAILASAHECDRAICLNWYVSIFGERQAVSLMRRHRALSQMSLF